MKKIGLLVGALVVCLGAGIFAGVKIGNKDRKSLLEKVADAVEDKQTLDVSTVQEIVKPAGDLVTQRYYYTDVDTFENYKEVLGAKIPLTTDRTIFTYRGIISAGIVLNQVTFEVDNEAMTITITLPPVFILSHEVDEQGFKAYEVKNSIFTETKIADYSALMGQLKMKKADELLKNEEFMTSAKEEAKQVITSFLNASTLSKDYKIVFKE